jgi:HlyD family secretion protein
VGSAEQRDNAKRDLELKRIALEQAQAEIRLLRAGFRPEEVAAAEAEVQRAQADQQYLEKKLALLTISSPIDGTVMTPKFRDHLYEKVTAGSTVCEVADTSKVRVEIHVPERQIDVIALGQPTVVKVQSYPLHPFTGNVTFIGSAIEQKDDQRILRVVTEIDNPDGLLREHMSGYGEINTGRSRVLRLLLRRFVRWIRVRFLV